MEHIRPLPYRMPLVHCESTGSFVTRLAARHGQSVSHLLATVGEGRSAADIDPWQSELYFNAAARQRLATLARRPLAQLTRALASLRDEHLLPDGSGAPAYKWPWRPHSGFLVRGCALCAARRGVLDPVWLIRPDPWHICVQHGRFYDIFGDDRLPFIDLSPGPHVLRAELRRLRLVRRLGPVGRLLVADAFAVLAHPAVHLPRLGGSRTALLRLLPTAVTVAYRMARLERLRLDGRLIHDDYRRWCEEGRSDLGWQLGMALGAWSERHLPLQLPPLPYTRAARPPSRHYRQPGFPHQPAVPEMAPVDKLTCLSWEILARGPRPYG
ncbi:TniQ family protein [Streptomyces sp. NBC_00882]|uniref:TniQ family protein n=1 Tax=Streptomyces sp. NBC_00882 TaxID=2975856 RepID=UPI0038654ED9|nr:TniQ family protein [Streptomyces sp. NBC_00882]WSZ36889.1 TniQ family protein [Streptomyces sp. NBC_00882]